MSEKIKSVCQLLGVTFSNEKLLAQALSHRSMGEHNNERLEFLGDSILNFIVGSALFIKHPSATEGELSRLRAALVKGETLASIAQEFQLGDFLLLGPGELKSGGFKRESILSGALEAIIGAIYLDQGFSVCEEAVNRWYRSRLNQLNSAENCKDPKTQLQETVQSRHFDIPVYTLLETIGQAHQQTFIVSCEVKEFGIYQEGEGSSRRRAEQAAAEKVLQEINRLKNS